MTLIVCVFDSKFYCCPPLLCSIDCVLTHFNLYIYNASPAHSHSHILTPFKSLPMHTQLSSACCGGGGRRGMLKIYWNMRSVMQPYTRNLNKHFFFRTKWHIHFFSAQSNYYSDLVLRFEMTQETPNTPSNHFAPKSLYPWLVNYQEPPSVPLTSASHGCRWVLSMINLDLLLSQIMKPKLPPKTKWLLWIISGPYGVICTSRYQP